MLKLHPGPNDVSRLAPGVYFVQLKHKLSAQTGLSLRLEPELTKVIVTR